MMFWYPTNKYDNFYESLVIVVEIFFEFWSFIADYVHINLFEEKTNTMNNNNNHNTESKDKEKNEKKNGLI